MNEAGFPETVVIGVGNPLMGDDGLGLEVLERLRAGWSFDPPLELVDGGTWGLNLLPIVERSRRVLFLDAINMDRTPGTLIELDSDGIPRFLARKLSPHQIDVKEVLALAELRGTFPEELLAIGLQPESIEMRTSLSPPVAERLDELVERVLDRLRAWGYAARAREEGTGA
jgi:hydrogenase maturation protease